MAQTKVSLSEVSMNAKKLKEKLAQDSGVPQKEINDSTLKEVSKVMDGAQKVAEKGQDPTTVAVPELKKLAGGEEKKEDPEAMTNQQKLAMSLAVLAPTLIGYGFGGAEGGALGASIGGKGVEQYGKGIEAQKEKQRLLAKESADRSIKDRALAKDERKQQKDEEFKERELNLKEKEIESTRELKRLERDLNNSKDKRDLEIRLGQNFQGNALVKEHAQATTAIKKIREAANNTTGNAYNDVALVFNFMKVLDPGSTVRDTEYATAANAAGVPERVKKLWAGVKDGEKLTPDQRSEILAASEKQYRASEESFGSLQSQYQRVAAEYGVRPENVTMTFDQPVAKKEIPKDTQQAAAPPPQKGSNPLQNEAIAAPAWNPPRKKALEEMSEEELMKYKEQLKGG